MYYKLECDLSECSGSIQQEANKHVTMMEGTVVDESRLSIPCPFSLRVNPEEELRFVDFYEGKTLMSKRLVEALRSAGVDNLQAFPAEIVDNTSGKIYRDHVVFNIVGMVSCADDSTSESTPLADVKFYHKLVIDPERTVGLKMFRLAESRMDIIVSEEVARFIRDGNFAGVVLEPV